MSSPKRHVLISLLFVLKCFSKSLVIRRCTVCWRKKIKIFLHSNRKFYSQRLWKQRALIRKRVHFTLFRDIAHWWGIFIIVLRRYLLQRDAPGKSIFLMSCVLVILALPCRYLGEQNAETAMLILAAPMAWCYLLFFCR